MTETAANRVTLLTPAGSGALATVRVSGPATREFLEKYFDKPVSPSKCVHGSLRDQGDIVDDPVVVLGADASFADLTLHGGPWVVTRTLELATRFGFVASAAIATDDAVDSIERNVLQSLPSARTKLALQVLLAQLEAWRTMLRDNDLAAMRAAIDDRSLQHLLDPPRVAIVGVPNAGKSTLANQLFGSNRVITADLPGTTRDWVGEIADANGLAVMLIDTPGLRASNDMIEQHAIAVAGRQIASADVVVLVLDASVALDSAQHSLIEQFKGAIVVLNKADRESGWSATIADPVKTVATTGTGVDELRSRIAARFGCDGLDDPASRTKARCWLAEQCADLSTRLATFPR